MWQDIVERFKWNIANDDDPFDQDKIIELYSNFESSFLFEGDLEFNYDQKVNEAIDFISKELKAIATSILAEIFSKK